MSSPGGLLSRSGVLRLGTFALLGRGGQGGDGAGGMLWDHFSLPPTSWSADVLDAIGRGCEQLLDWRGFAPDRPLEGLGIGPFYALLHLFHFERVSQALLASGPPGKLLDEMRMRHVVNDQEIVLYNLVDPPTAAKPIAPCPYCGAPLRTAKAKQCRACGADWHDPEKVTMGRR